MRLVSCSSIYYLPTPSFCSSNYTNYSLVVIGPVDKSLFKTLIVINPTSHFYYHFQTACHNIVTIIEVGDCVGVIVTF